MMSPKWAEIGLNIHAQTAQVGLIGSAQPSISTSKFVMQLSLLVDTQKIGRTRMAQNRFFCLREGYEACGGRHSGMGCRATCLC